MLESLAASADAWLETIGRLHPAAVHFPIALLTVAGGIELWTTITRKRPASHSAFVCLAFGAVAAVVAVILGLIDARYTNMDDVSTHQWLGIATAIFAAILVALALLNRPDRANPFYRIGLILLPFLVSATGYYGGELTYGEGYLTNLIWAAPASSQPTDNTP